MRPLVSRLGKTAVLWSVVSRLVAGRAGLPERVASRPDLPACSGDRDVFLPVAQAPVALKAHSGKALDCLRSSVENGEPAELEFVLMGVEGEEYQAIVKVFDDDTVDYFRENDWGWELHVGCREISFPEPGIPEVNACELTQVDS